MRSETNNQPQTGQVKTGLIKLEESGITDAYEYVLRKLCIDGLPTQNYYEVCAVYLLEYEKIMIDNKIRTKPLKELVDVKGNNNDKIQKNKNTDVASIIGNKKKIKLKTKEFAVSNFNIAFENKNINNYDALLPPKIELNSCKLLENEIKNAPSSNVDDKICLKDYFEIQDKELIQLHTLAEDINYVNYPLESFEVEVDIVNHISESGGLERVKLEINEKSPQIPVNSI